MSFGFHTPESLLPRSDSKNPATTCRGITANGRRCRRGLAASPSTSPTPSPTRGLGVLAVLQDDTDKNRNAAAFYCWQHKDQADQLGAMNSMTTKLYPLKEKSSIDTLVDRLGILDLEEDVQQKRRPGRHHNAEMKLKKRDTMPAGWHEMQSPLMTVPEGFERPQQDPKRRVRPEQRRSNVKASFLCCLRADDDDVPPTRKRYNSSTRPATYQNPPAMTYISSSNSRPKPDGTLMPPIQKPPPVHRKPFSEPTRPSQQSPSITQSSTQALLSPIPTNLPPQTVASLLTELSRPLTDTDLKTSGYIYIFWLTPETAVDTPDSDIASTILDDDTSPSFSRRTVQDQLLQRYSSQRRPPNATLTHQTSHNRTVLLKIGRATNVHRRMTQWQKQCGHNITLLRYYPDKSTRNSSSSSSVSPQPVPFLPRVERLIQLELADQRVKQEERCSSCGREHREWFEVAATRSGVRAVDECVRRWVLWAQAEIDKRDRVQQEHQVVMGDSVKRNRATPQGYF